MFESAELGRRMSRAEYDEAVAELRPALLEAQFALKKSKSSVLVVISGADGAGKGEVVHRLNEWLDPRGVDTHAFWQSSEEEEDRPPFWRYWRALPARGRIGILFGSWYSQPIVQRVYGKIKSSEVDTEMDRIAFFERMLAEDGAVIVKFWFHLSRKAQKRQLKELDQNPRTHWRVLPSDWKHLKRYSEFAEISERAIRRTDTGHAPWHIIEASDRRFREYTAARLLLDAILKKLSGTAPEVPSIVVAPKKSKQRDAAVIKPGITILDRVDLSQDLSEKEYRKQLEKHQGRLTRLSWAAWEKKVASVLLFEGWDGAGKGSAIRRVTAAIDPRLYHIVAIAAPSDEERARHYLWRFWRYLPRRGRTTIFDRTWYGRVLVERVEGFATDDEWKRAYLEINDFEEQLADNGVVLSKFWIHISKEEQLKRFKERQEVAFKRFKITEEDWRNRDKWDQYKHAVNDMVEHTSTALAPWTIIAGNSKRFARVEILKTLCERLSEAL